MFMVQMNSKQFGPRRFIFGAPSNVKVLLKMSMSMVTRINFQQLMKLNFLNLDHPRSPFGLSSVWHVYKTQLLGIYQRMYKATWCRVFNSMPSYNPRAYCNTSFSTTAFVCRIFSSSFHASRLCCWITVFANRIFFDHDFN